MFTGFSEHYLIIIQEDACKIHQIAKKPSKPNSICLPMKKEISGYSLVAGTLNYIIFDFGYQNFGVFVKK